MFATANFEVKIPGSKSPPYQSMRVTQIGWVIKYLMDNGAGFPEKVHFTKVLQAGGEITLAPACVLMLSPPVGTLATYASVTNTEVNLPTTLGTAAASTPLFSYSLFFC